MTPRNVADDENERLLEKVTWKFGVMPFYVANETNKLECKHCSAELGVGRAATYHSLARHGGRFLLWCMRIMCLPYFSIVNDNQRVNNIPWSMYYVGDSMGSFLFVSHAPAVNFGPPKQYDLLFDHGYVCVAPKHCF